MRNIRERAKRIGRDVDKEEVVSKFYGFHIYLRDILKKYPNISHAIYNKETNKTIDLDLAEQAIEHFGFQSIEEVAREYDRIKAKLDLEERDQLEVEKER